MNSSRGEGMAKTPLWFDCEPPKNITRTYSKKLRRAIHNMSPWAFIQYTYCLESAEVLSNGSIQVAVMTKDYTIMHLGFDYSHEQVEPIVQMCEALVRLDKLLLKDRS